MPNTGQVAVRGYGYYNVIDKPLWWQERGLLFNSTGYGRKIPTRDMVRVEGHWHRIYCCIFSNSGTLYICKAGQKVIVEY